MGICDHVCPADELESHLMEQARNYVSHDSTYLASLKRAMSPDFTKLDEWFEHELMAIVRNAL